MISRSHWLFLTYLVCTVNIILFLIPHQDHQHVQHDLKILFRRFDDFCHEYNIEYWAIGGTLLGSTRHQDMIPWDDDGDVAVPEEHFTRMKMLCTSIPERDLGFRLEKHSPVCWKVFGTHLTGFLDIFPVEHHKDRWRKVSTRARTLWPNCWFLEHEVYPLVRIPVGYVEGRVVYMNGPRDPIPFLTRHYGTTWDIPQYTHSHTVYGLQENIFYPIAVISSCVMFVVLSGVFPLMMMVHRKK